MRLESNIELFRFEKSKRVSMEPICRGCIPLLSSVGILEAFGRFTLATLPLPLSISFARIRFIGEFEYVEQTTKRGIIVRIWTQMGKKDKGLFSVDCAARCLDFYEKLS